MVALRVLFALLPVLSCGFLAWGTMLRLAILTRRSRDWTLLGVVSVLSVGWLALIGADPTPDTDGWQGNTGAGGVILTGVLTCVYFLYADIRHHEARAAAPAGHWYPQGAAPYAVPPQTTPGYGYPHAPRQQTGPSHQPPAHQQPPAQAPHAVPAQPPQPTPPPRIGQVRAELDELSELLRKQTPHPRQAPRDEDPHR
ncbi:hypothetical protein [Streptomyces sp. NPDC002990]